MASEQQQQHTSEYLERVFLEDLHVYEKYDNQGFRLILRPTYRPQGNTQAPRVTLETAAEYLRAFTLLADLPESSPKYASYPQNVFKVVGVAQNASGINFSMRIKVSGEQGGCEISCDFFCDPTNDDVLFRTNSRIPIEISSIREVVTEQQLNSSVDFENGKTMSPGLWRLSSKGESLLDMRVLARPQQMVGHTLLPGLLTITSDEGQQRESNLKRPRPTSQEQGLTSQGKPAPKRGKPVGKGGRALNVLNDSSKQESSQLVLDDFKPRMSRSNHMILLASGETLHVPAAREVESYQVTKRSQIASPALSEVYLAEHSKLRTVVVKITKTTPGGDSEETRRRAIRAAETWLGEFQIHGQLRHTSIVELKGGDARYLALYLEHVPGKDLASAGTWVDVDHHFTGTEVDALHIWRDIARALDYLHHKNIEHNDIKPSNILFSKERGAVLCDFGLSRPAGSLTATRGTPYYLPPEFLRVKERGKPGDIWAFGVTMLYVLRHMRLPDSWARLDADEHLHWHIRQVHKAIESGTQSEDHKKMSAWIRKIGAITKRLTVENEQSFILKDMLDFDKNHRITASELVQRLTYLEPDHVSQTRAGINAGAPAISATSDFLTRAFYDSATTEKDTSLDSEPE